MTQFANQMSQGRKGMIEQHTRPCPSHDSANARLHLRPIAVDGAMLARRFVRTKAAAVQAAVGIEQEFLALRTEARMALFASAVQAYHLLDHSLFFLYALVCFHELDEGFLMAKVSSRYSRLPSM